MCPTPPEQRNEGLISNIFTSSPSPYNPGPFKCGNVYWTVLGQMQAQIRQNVDINLSSPVSASVSESRWAVQLSTPIGNPVSP